MRACDSPGWMSRIPSPFHKKPPAEAEGYSRVHGKLAR